jgi:hypothetical protein
MLMNSKPFYCFHSCIISFCQMCSSCLRIRTLKIYVLYTNTGVRIAQMVVQRLALGWTARVRLQAGKRFFSTPQRPDRILVPSSRQSNWCQVPGAISPGVYWPGREADHSPPASAEVKNSGAIPPVKLMCSWSSA